MEVANPIFEKNYEDYLRQLDNTKLSMWESVLNITVDEKRKTARIPFSKPFTGCRHSVWWTTRVNDPITAPA